MKFFKTIFLVSTLLWVISCDNQNKNEVVTNGSYSIAITTDISTKGALKLYEIIAGNRKMIDTVSFEANKSDRKILEGKISYPGFYYLEIAENQGYFFALDTQPLEVTITGTLDMPLFNASSTDINDFFYKVDQLKTNYNTVVDSMNQAFIFAQNMKDDAKIKKLEKDIDTLTSVLYYSLKKEFYAHPRSIVSIYTANIMGFDSEPSLNDSLVQELTPYQDQSLYVKNYISSITKLSKIRVGGLAPEFMQATNDGRTKGVKDYRGKYVLLDFWASWCGPCRKANPKLVAIYEKYKSKNFEILGISLDEDVVKWKAAIESDRLKWNHVSDLKGWENEVAQMYNVEGIPASFLVDPNGKIVAYGFQIEELDEILSKTLK